MLHTASDATFTYVLMSTPHSPHCGGPATCGLLCALAVSEPVAPPAGFCKQPSSLVLSQAFTVAFAVASICGCFIRTQTDQPVFSSSSACFCNHSRSLSLSKAFALLSQAAQLAFTSSPLAFAFTGIHGRSRKQTSPRHFRKPAFVFASSPGRFGKQPR